MNKRLFKVIMSILLFSAITYSGTTTVVLQNGLNDYSGAQDNFYTYGRGSSSPYHIYKTKNGEAVNSTISDYTLKKLKNDSTTWLYDYYVFETAGSS